MDFNLFCVSLLLVFCSSKADAAFCDELLQVKLEGQVTENAADGSVVHENIIYPKGTHWKTEAGHFGCPCKVKHCVRLCTKEQASDNNLSLPDKNFEFDIFNQNNDGFKRVQLYQHFYVIPEGRVCNDAVFEESDDFHILSSGLLYIKSDNSTHQVEDYCLFTEDNEAGVLNCNSVLVDNAAQKILFTACTVISIVFLFLTLVAFFASPDMKNSMKGRSIACQSATLMIAMVSFIPLFWMDPYDSEFMCQFFAYSAYYFIMSSFFWLNTMCFDIFQTFGDFKNMTGSLNRSFNRKFIFYAIYSTFVPLIFLAIVIILNHTLDEESVLFPGIGVSKCWFKDRKTEPIFYQGPILLILLSNIVFFSIALNKLLGMYRESKVLRRGNSRMHRKNSGSSTTGGEGKEKLLLYVKLFLLMGIPWTTEIISWFVGGNWIWILADLFNCLRGVFIFYFCVWSSKKVRYPFLALVSAKYAHKVAERRMTRSFTLSKGSAPSEPIRSPRDTVFSKPSNHIESAL